MITQLWNATITHIGDEAQDMIDAGVIILFGEPVPDALAEVSIVHDGANKPQINLAPGMIFTLGSQQFTVDEVGDRAAVNLTDLGHVVIYVNQPEQELLPGAVKASGDQITRPEPGQTVGFQEG